MNMANLVAQLGASLDNKQVVLFSYGSGALASMMSVIPRADCGNTKFSLEKIQSVLRITERLEAREKLTAEDLNVALNAREASHGVIPFKPTFLTDRLAPGTYYLVSISDNYERFYQRKPLDAAQIFHGPLHA